ncbi:MAG TPA: hypothetical protein V6C97_19385 [Oculatellaceae cyanobacterium]
MSLAKLELVADPQEFQAAGLQTSASSQRLIEEYEEQYSMQNSTKNYVCVPAHSLEAAYVEQFRKMAQRDDYLKEVPVAESNRFDVSVQMRMPDEELQSLEELVVSFRTRKMQRVAALRRNQIVCEESFSTQCRLMGRRLRNVMVAHLQDMFEELKFALKQFSLYSN